VKSALALLRGINVGTGRKVAMSDLRAVFEDAGATAVTTYIQSGNVVFSHPSRSLPALESELERRITALAGFDVAVMLRTAGDFAAIIADAPFPKAALPTVHVAFLKQRPTRAARDALTAAAAPGEEVAFGIREAYLHLPNGVGRAKLPAALPKLETPATVRNWRTVTKLHELASGT
jgi:uncharacterized protein (DUF1697 family)